MEFHFNEKILRALTDPILYRSSVIYKPGISGWRDNLCSLIGDRIKSALFVGGKKIELHFYNDSILTIPLVVSSSSGPEAVHFICGDNSPVEIW